MQKKGMTTAFRAAVFCLSILLGVVLFFHTTHAATLQDYINSSGTNDTYTTKTECGFKEGSLFTASSTYQMTSAGLKVYYMNNETVTSTYKMTITIWKTGSDHKPSMLVGQTYPFKYADYPLNTQQWIIIPMLLKPTLYTNEEYAFVLDQQDAPECDTNNKHRIWPDYGFSSSIISPYIYTTNYGTSWTVGKRSGVDYATNAFQTYSGTQGSVPESYSGSGSTATSTNKITITYPPDDGSHVFDVYPGNYFFNFLIDNTYGNDSVFWLNSNATSFPNTTTDATNIKIIPAHTKTYSAINLLVATDSPMYYIAHLEDNDGNSSILPFATIGHTSSTPIDYISPLDIPDIMNEMFPEWHCPIKFMLGWDPCYQTQRVSNDIGSTVGGMASTSFTYLMQKKPYSYVTDIYEVSESWSHSTTTATSTGLNFTTPIFGTNVELFNASTTLHTAPYDDDWWKQWRPYENMLIYLGFLYYLISAVILT